MRLIDADKTIGHIKARLLETALNNCDAVCDASYLYQECADNRIEVWVDEMPTVDPIKHGHWISCDNDGDSPYKCSVCGGVKVNENGEWLDICQQEWSKMPYCAVCGAKMDEYVVKKNLQPTCNQLATNLQLKGEKMDEVREGEQ